MKVATSLLSFFRTSPATVDWFLADGSGANTPPTAAFIPSCTDLDCQFTDASTDADGTVVSWEWDFGDGNTSTEQHPSHTYAAGGTYTVTLTATDDLGASDVDAQDITVAAANVPPVASFTVACTDLSCDFTDASVDTDGTVVSWDWDFGDGNTSTEQHPSHTYAAGGIYTVTLTATDDVGATDTDAQDVAVTAGNAPPVASFTVTCAALGCEFTDTSVDTDGAVVSWNWEFGDGNASTEQHPNHTYATDGVYTVTLTATDDLGASDVDAQDVTVGTANTPPVASFTVACTDLTCDFTDASTDADGAVVGWDWDFGDGNTSTEQHPSHSYAAGGTYTVTLTATDDVGTTDADAQDVTVTGTNTPPVASFTVSCTDLDCQFTDASTDADGAVVSWNWDFGDGNTSTEQHPSHGFAAGGTYTVTLTATDDLGATDSDTQDVTVTAGAASPITLTLLGFTNIQKRVRVSWDGATTSFVEIYRDGVLIVTTQNDGLHTDVLGDDPGTAYAYQICEVGTEICSEVVTVTL